MRVKSDNLTPPLPRSPAPPLSRSSDPSLSGRPHLHRRAANGGVLLETLIAALLFSVLVLAWMELLQSIQSACITGFEANRIQVGARVLHRTFWLSIHQAGLNRQRDYLDLSASGVLTVVSDLNGSEGDPDNRLDHPFERQGFRIDPEFSSRMSGAAFDQAANLQWRSGAGNFQPFVANLTEIRHRLKEGRSGTHALSTTVRMRGRFTGLKRGGIPDRSFVFDFPLEKNREQWFCYEFQQE